MAQKNISENGLYLLFTIVNRSKVEFFTDLIRTYSSNMQVTCLAEGTAGTLKSSGIGEITKEKAVILSVIQEDRKQEIMDALDEKMHKIRRCDGIAYTVPFTSVIGVSVFNYLSNNNSVSEEVK